MVLDAPVVLGAHVHSELPSSARVVSSSWEVPEEVEAGPGGTLRWRGDSTGRPLTLLSEKVGEEEGLVFAFARLADADDGDVIEFARQFGVLGLCDHQLPHTHVTGRSASGWRPHELTGRGGHRGCGSDSVELWRTGGGTRSMSDVGHLR